MSRDSSYYHKDYSGGLNTSSSKKEIQRNEASYIRNWDITYRGRLYRRKGLTQKGDTLTNEIDAIHSYLRGSAGKDVVLIEGGTLRYLNSTTWDSLDTGFTSGTKTWVETCPINRKIYISNQTDTQHSWDRVSTTNNSCLTDLGATVPHGNVVRWHKNHMFTVNNVTVSATTYANRLYWSAFGDPDTYDTTNDFLEVPGQGRAITLGGMGDTLAIFKENSIQFLNGWGDSDWRLTASASNVANFDEAVGCVAPRGVTRVGNELWFMDNEGIIRRLYQTDFDAFRRDIVSSKIDDTLAGLNKNQIEKTVAMTFDDKVYFFVPDGPNTDNNIVLVYDLIASKRTGEEAWTVYDGWEVSVATVHPTGATIDLYLGDINGKVYIHSGNDDDGVAISSRWDGKQDDYDQPDKYKRYSFGYTTADNQGDIDVGVYASVDGSPFANISTFNLQGSGSKLGPTGSFLLGPTGGCKLSGGEVIENKHYFDAGGNNPQGRTLQMSYRHSATGERPYIDTFTNHFKTRTLR